MTLIASYAGTKSRAGRHWHGAFKAAFVRGVCDHREGSPREPVPYPLKPPVSDNPGTRKGWLSTWRVAWLDGWDSDEGKSEGEPD